MNKRHKEAAAALVSAAAAAKAGEVAAAPAGEMGPAAMLVLCQDQERPLSTILAYLGPAVRDCFNALLVSKAWYTALAVGDPWTHILRRLYPSCLSLLTGDLSSTLTTAAASTTDPGAKANLPLTAKALLCARLFRSNPTITQAREEERLAKLFHDKHLTLRLRHPTHGVVEVRVA